jgi:TonB family protein
MKKRIILVGVLSFSVAQVWAQNKDVITVFMANSGNIVESKEKADFVRQILPPDPEVDKKTSTVLDFYMNGNKKLVAHTRDAGMAEALYGSYIEYFKDGSRKSIRSYKNGALVGQAVYYYPNGQTYYTATDSRIVQSFDVNGKETAANGNGKWIIYDDAFKAIAEGPIVNGLQNGEWTASVNGVKTTGVYEAGKLVSGNLFTNDNKVYNNSKDLDVMAAYPGGEDQLAAYLSSEVKYPKLVRANKLEGEVLVNFIVEKDGALSNVKVEKGLGSGCDEEAVRLIEKSQPWIPGELYGAPRRVSYTVNVVFSTNPTYRHSPYYINNMQSIQRPMNVPATNNFSMPVSHPAPALVSH